MRLFEILCAGAMLAWNGTALAADATPPNIAEALASAGRPHTDILLDGQLKTAEVLAFAGVKPGQAAVQLLPETGYYARLLSLAVGSKGQLDIIVPMAAGPGMTLEQRRGALLPKEVIQGRPLSRIEYAYSLEDQPEFPNLTTYWETADAWMSLPKQADLVFSANAYHVFKSGEVGKFDAATMNKQIFQATNNGGTYLVIDNAADADTVKKEVTAAGFVLDGESKALAPASFTLRFKKPMDAANTNMRPPNPIAALSGYFGNTRRGNVGAELERRVMYHADGTYQEYGALKTGASPFQSGIWFYRADGQGCMLHKFPLDQRSQVNCSTGRAVPYKQVGDKWNGADDNRPYELVKGYLYFDE